MQNWMWGISQDFFVTNGTNTEAYSYATQTFMMKLLGKLVNGSQQLTTFIKSSILDVRVGSECVFAVVSEEHQYQYGMEDIQSKK